MKTMRMLLIIILVASVATACGNAIVMTGPMVSPAP